MCKVSSFFGKIASHTIRQFIEFIERNAKKTIMVTSALIIQNPNLVLQDTETHLCEIIIVWPWKIFHLKWGGSITLIKAVFQRSRIRSKKSGAEASRIRSRSFCRISGPPDKTFIGSFCFKRSSCWIQIFCFIGAPVKKHKGQQENLC